MDYVDRVVASGQWKNEWPWCWTIDVLRMIWRFWTLRQPTQLNPLPPSLTYTNASPPIPLITSSISIQAHLSHLPFRPLSQAQHYLSHPTRLTSLSLFSTVKSQRYTLPPMLSAVLSAAQPLANWSFTTCDLTSPLDHKSLILIHTSLIPIISTFSNYPILHVRPISAHSFSL